MAGNDRGTRPRRRAASKADTGDPTPSQRRQLIVEPPAGESLRSLKAVGVIAVALAVAAIGTATVLSSIAGNRSTTGAHPPATNALSPPGAAAGVAGSQALLTDFDLFATDSEVEGWSTGISARLVVAAVPNAADRSAQLDGTRLSRACRDLDIRFSALEATFMFDAVPTAGLTVLRLALDDGTAPRLSLSDGRATVAITDDGSMLEADTWYRWLVHRDGTGLEMSLLAPDGMVLSNAVAPAVDEGTRATEFCMGSRAPARLYLTELKLETP